MSGINWDAVGVFAAVALGYGVLIWYSVKNLLDNQKGHTKTLLDGYKEHVDDKFDGYKEHVDEKFEALQTEARKNTEEWQRVERNLLQLKADLPKHYVLRDDWIRFSAVIDAKQDTLNERVGRVSEHVQRILVKLEGEHDG